MGVHQFGSRMRLGCFQVALTFPVETVGKSLAGLEDRVQNPPRESSSFTVCSKFARSLTEVLADCSRGFGDAHGAVWETNWANVEGLCSRLRNRFRSHFRSRLRSRLCSSSRGS